MCNLINQNFTWGELSRFSKCASFKLDVIQTKFERALKELILYLKPVLHVQEKPGARSWHSALLSQLCGI